MADFLTEAQFLSVFWGLTADRDEQAGRFMAHITAEMFESPEVGQAYKLLTETYSRGEDTEDFTMQSKMRGILKEGYSNLWEDHLIGGRNLKGYAAKILLNHRARRQAVALQSLADEAKGLIGKGEGSAHKIMDKTISALIDIHHNSSSTARPQTRADLTSSELSSIEVVGSTGIPMPYQKLHTNLGPLIAGDLVGISGYSNSGKSTFLSNLWREWALMDVPMIVFPTEMREGWLRRGYASHSRIPQMIAERRQWDISTVEQRAAYSLAVSELGKAPWEMVNQPRITPKEIIARATVLRRKYSGRKVVIMVDHMHRLDYGGHEPDFMVGDATQRLRDWAGEDQEGGIILILLYQPRKPSDEIELYKPVMGHQIRGKSSVWNELDIHLSPYRRWVKCDQTGYHKTPWGSPSGLFSEKGLPDFCAPNEAGGKLDDQHVYVKIDKRRVGGEGPTVILDIEAPSGYTYERVENVQVGEQKLIRAI
jgi:replicative DNA helicase